MNALWPEQEVFCTRVEDFARREGLLTKRGGIDIPAVAARFDLSPATLKQFRQNKKRPQPHVDTLEAIAGVIGSDADEFRDSPNKPLPGVPKDRWASASRQDRALASAILADLMAIPEAEKDSYYKLWKQGIEIGRARVEAEKKPKR